MKEKKSRASDLKKRHWLLVVYPDSCPENWVELLQSSGLRCAISPLHDKDVNPTGEPKKAHWHVLVSYDGPTTFNSVSAFTDALNAPIPKPCESVRGAYRYLSHKDNPEKFQYDEADVRTVNGFNIADFVELTKSEVDEIKRQLIDLIMERDLLEYSDLLEHLRVEGMLAELSIAGSHTLLFDAYLRSRRHRTKPFRVDPKTGEVLTGGM